MVIASRSDEPAFPVTIRRGHVGSSGGDCISLGQRARVHDVGGNLCGSDTTCP